MKELTIKEKKEIYAGSGMSATFINSLLKGFNIFTDLGRYLGSSLRRIFENNMCNF